VKSRKDETVTLSLKQIDVAVLFVADLKRSKTFYRDTLGIPMKFEDEASAAFDFGPVMLIVLTVESARNLLSDEAVGDPGTPAQRRS
jgi:catechol 2,3-dioxygenase-like lactoylglutathione lyase family enzyme